MQSKDWWKVFRTLQGFDWSSSRELYIHRFLQHFLLYCYRSYPPTSTKHWSTNEMQILTKLFQGIEIYSKRRSIHHTGITICWWHPLLHKHWARSTTSDWNFQWGMWLVRYTNISQKNRSYDTKTPFRPNNTRPWHNNKWWTTLSLLVF